jgi:hypothetical protein
MNESQHIGTKLSGSSTCLTSAGRKKPFNRNRNIKELDGLESLLNKLLQSYSIEGMNGFHRNSLGRRETWYDPAKRQRGFRVGAWEF